jgi:hypothetical protein
MDVILSFNLVAGFVSYAFFQHDLQVGFLILMVIVSKIAERGDLHWAKILDDPDIPYVYKTEMIFEILRARLGKGAVYVANKENFIVPGLRPIDLAKETITLPQ